MAARTTACDAVNNRSPKHLARHHTPPVGFIHSQSHGSLPRCGRTSPMVSFLIRNTPDVIHNALRSYQVPKEVGKIGTESPTFIEPVTARKDGIQAMFARQTAKTPTSPSSSQAPAGPKTPQKRKRSSSPKAPSSTPNRVLKTPKRMKHEVVDLCDDKPEREAKTFNTLEDDGLECVDPPEPKKKIVPVRIHRYPPVIQC